MEQDSGSDEIPEYAELLQHVANLPHRHRVPRRVARKNLEQAFLTSFELIGGVPRLALWADQNPTQFYQLCSKLFPQQVEGKLGVDGSLAQLLMKMGSSHQPAIIEQVQDAQIVSESTREALPLHVHARESEHTEESK